MKIRLIEIYKSDREIIEKTPTNENDLVNLRNLIAENDVNLAKINTEVNYIYSFMLIME